MWLKTFLIALGAFLVGLVAALFISKTRLDRENARLVDELLADAGPEPGRVFRLEDLVRLPEPVQRYLGHVLTDGQPHARTVRVRQSGEFLMGDAAGAWKPFTATQHFTVDPPGFFWDASITMAPLLPVRVIDAYRGGEGTLRAKILSVVPVVDSEPGPEMNAGELVRYLAETVWFPTALLPGGGVEWQSINERSARATLEHLGTTVSLVFFFNDRDEVERVFAETRYREVDGAFEPTPWTGRFSNYQLRNGMLIPLDGEVAWNLPSGDLTYWRGHVEEIEHH